MRFYGSLWVLIGLYKSLLLPSGCLCVFIDPYRSL